MKVNVLGLCMVVILLVSSVHAEPLHFVTQDFPPFTYLVDGRPSGPGVEIVLTVCRMEGLACRIDSLPWPRAQMQVRDGEGDALFLLGRSEEREQWLWFSPPLIRSGYSFFERSEDAVLKNQGLDGLNDTVVGVYGPSNTSKHLQTLREELSESFFVDMTSNDEAAFKKLSWGRVDAVFSNSSVGRALVAKLNLKNIIETLPYEELDYYIGYSRKSPKSERLRQFDSRLVRMRESGVISRILSRYYLNGASGSR